VSFDRRTIEIADARGATHDDSDPTYYNDPKIVNRLGVAGELEFADFFGLDYDVAEHTQHPEGDGGIDFTVYLTKHRYRLTIDVKTALKPYYLLLKEQQIGRGAQVLVLYGYDLKSEAAYFVGWEWRREMATMPVRTFGRHKQRNFYRARAELRPLAELCALMALRVDARPM